MKTKLAYSVFFPRIRSSIVAPSAALSQDSFIHRCPVNKYKRAWTKCENRRSPLVAVYSLEFYKSLEGFSDDSSSVLPDDVIYASLRRKAEKMCFEAALAVCKELAGAGASTMPAVRPSCSLSPRKCIKIVSWRL